ncbi:MAG: hypothetical protein Q8P55_02185 [bacterium]|nr:hypothetical protein [bacterium]
MHKILIAVVILMGVIILGLVAAVFLLPGENKTTACTQEAKICSDGSAVGRTGPNCEFTPCPEELTSGIEGMVLLGPLCPVVREGEECPDRPFETMLAVIADNQGGVVVKEFSSNAAGEFKVNLVPGIYSIRSADSESMLPFCSTGVFEVQKDGYTNIAVQCDTGIR